MPAPPNGEGGTACWIGREKCGAREGGFGSGVHPAQARPCRANRLPAGSGRPPTKSHSRIKPSSGKRSMGSEGDGGHFHGKRGRTIGRSPLIWKNGLGKPSRGARWLANRLRKLPGSQGGWRTRCVTPGWTANRRRKLPGSPGSPGSDPAAYAAGSPRSPGSDPAAYAAGSPPGAAGSRRGSFLAYLGHDLFREVQVRVDVLHVVVIIQCLQEPHHLLRRLDILVDLH